MRKVFIVIFCILICKLTVAQDKFDTELANFTRELQRQLTNKSTKTTLGRDSNFYKVALVAIETDDGSSTKFTQQLETELAIDLANSSEGKYSVLDRNYILKLLTEKNIPVNFGNKKDFAKNLGRLKAAQLMIVGRVTNFDSEYRLVFSILETAEGSTVGGAKGKLTATDLLKQLNGEKIIEKNSSMVDQESKNSSTSNYQPPSNPCAKKTGDYCFKNESDIQLNLFSKDDDGKAITLALNPGESRCLYDLEAKTYQLRVYYTGSEREIQIRVQACATNPKPDKLKFVRNTGN